MGTALQIVHCTSVFLEEEYARFVRDRETEPIATWFAADGTEHRHKRTKIAQVGKHIAVRRLRTKNEFLQQRYFVISSTGARTCLVPEAVVLTCKTIWAHFEGQRAVAAHPRALGHNSILVRHNCWDGAVAAGCFRRTLQLERATLLHLARRFK